MPKRLKEVYLANKKAERRQNKRELLYLLLSIETHVQERIMVLFECKEVSKQIKFHRQHYRTQGPDSVCKVQRNYNNIQKKQRAHEHEQRLQYNTNMK